jgi:hypothetical protein
MTTRAAQIECLLTPVIDHETTSVASGCTVYFYSAGTTDAKNVWTEKEKTNPYTTRTLDSAGTVQVYGDGVYKIVVKDVDDTTVHEWDNYKVQANTFTVQTKTDAYTVTADDDMVICDGTFTLSIATVANFTHPLVIKRISGTITVDPSGSETIDGDSTVTLTSVDDAITLYPDTNATTWRRSDPLAGLTASATELNLLDGITAIEDEDDMSSDSDTSLATQQSIKAYADLMVKADGATGRVIRVSSLVIEDGTNANTIRCTLSNTWNGDAVSAVDNIPNDGTQTGGFRLYSGPSAQPYLQIDSTVLTGNCVGVIGATLWKNTTGTSLLVFGRDNPANDIEIMFGQEPSGSNIDIEVLVDTGDIAVLIAYVTDA